MEDTEGWDKEDVYDRQISPLMDKVLTICKEHNLPIVCSVQYARIDDGPMVCTSVILPKQADEHMRTLARAHRSGGHVSLVETITDRSDGSQEVRVSLIR